MAYEIQNLFGGVALPGTLYIVSTPIGNLEDITLRAIRTLKDVSVVAAEDTRHSLKLLSHYGISKPMISYWGEREKARAEEVIDKLKSGLSVALVSDAGTPGISDPGGVLIRRALDEGLEVVSIPGPSALVSAVSVSGLPTDEFTFIGFLPAKKSQRIKKLKELSMEPRTLVFYEAPHRVVDTLDDMVEVLGDRGAALVKELTKMYEKVTRGPLSKLADEAAESTVAGEYVIVVEGRTKEPGSPMTIDEAAGEVSALMKKGMGRKEAVKTVAAEYGLSSKELYERTLKG